MCRKYPGTRVILCICRPVPNESITEENKRSGNINIAFIKNREKRKLHLFSIAFFPIQMLFFFFLGLCSVRLLKSCTKFYFFLTEMEQLSLAIGNYSENIHCPQHTLYSWKETVTAKGCMQYQTATVL